MEFVERIIRAKNSRFRLIISSKDDGGEQRKKGKKREKGKKENREGLDAKANPRHLVI